MRFEEDTVRFLCLPLSATPIQSPQPKHNRASSRLDESPPPPPLHTFIHIQIPSSIYRGTEHNKQILVAFCRSHAALLNDSNMNTFADCAVRCALALKLAEEEDEKVVHMSPERERERLAESFIPLFPLCMQVPMRKSTFTVITEMPIFMYVEGKSCLCLKRSKKKRNVPKKERKEKRSSSSKCRPL